MRPIKFRGKSIMTVDELNRLEIDHVNGWVIGNLTQNGGNPFIVGDFIEVDEEYTVQEYWCPVHPESVGQYTGLKDKYRKEICEGDVYHMGDLNITYTVVWHDIGLIGKQNGSNSYAGLSHWKDRIEIISNIYDNPELLEIKK